MTILQNFYKFNQFDNSCVWIQTIDTDGRVITLNNFAKELIEYNGDELIGNFLFWEKAFRTQETGLRILNIIRNTIQKGQNIKSKLSEITARSGKKKQLLWSMEICKNDQGEITGAIITGFDHSEFNNYKKDTPPSTERYRHIFKNAPIGFFRSLPEGRFLEVNKAFATMLGYENPKELIKLVSNIGDEIYINSDFRKKLVEDTLNTEKVKSFETIFKNRQGNNIDVRINLSSRYDEEIQNHILEGTVENITDRKVAENELNKNLAKYSTLFEKSPISVLEIDYSEVKKDLEKYAKKHSDLKLFLIRHPEALNQVRQKINVIDVNAATLDLFEIKDKKYFVDEYHLSTSQALTEDEYGSFEALINNFTSYEYETIFRTTLSGEKKAIVRWAAEPETKLPFSRVLVSMTDITEQRNEQEALRKSKNQLTSLFSSMDDLVFIIDKDGTYQFVAHTRPDLLISEAGQLEGNNIADFLEPEICSKYFKAFNVCLTENKTTCLDYPLIIKGKKYWFEAKVTPLTSDQVIGKRFKPIA